MSTFRKYTNAFSNYFPFSVKSLFQYNLCSSLLLRLVSQVLIRTHSTIWNIYFSQLSHVLKLNICGFLLQSPVQRADHTDAMTTEKWVLLVIHLCLYIRACSLASAWAWIESSMGATTCLIWWRMLTETAMVSYRHYHFWNKQFCSDTVNSFLQLSKFF